VGEQQRVEILKALYREARILILDEPTAVLTPQEASSLFETLRTMAEEGRTIVFISHKLHEVMAVADRVTVLRRARSIATVAVADTSTRELASLMVGRELTGSSPRQSLSLGDVVLSVEGLCADGDRGVLAVKDVTLAVHAGEIVGVAGVAGNGQRELAETITGLRRAVRGVIRVDGRTLPNGDPRAAIAARIAHIPEDRLHTGVAAGLSIASNVVLKSYRDGDHAYGPLLRSRAILERARTLIHQFDVHTPGPHVPARQLSGGNLQKVVIGREFMGTPRVLIAAAPTRGLDVGAIETVQAYLREAATLNVAVLLISEDLDEVLALADRIVVMYEGAIAGDVDAGTATVEEIGLLMAGEGAS
jgi:simple sugar transport system ATP-binding protein